MNTEQVNPLTIKAYQAQVDKWIKTFGVRYFSELTNLGILMEEVGEVSRIMTRTYGDQSFKTQEPHNLADELADVLFVVCCIANQTGVDLTSAIEKNFMKKTCRDKDRHKNNSKLTCHEPESETRSEAMVNKDKIMDNKDKAMDTCKLNGVLGFLKGAEQLKNTLRTSYTSQGRHESTAEHSWRLCLMALVLETQFAPINIEKLLKLCTVHDLGEAIHGDIAAVDQTANINKNINERKDLVQLAKPLPRQLQKTITDLWDEYEKGATKEAKVAKALDKLETLLQHTQAGKKQTIDYKFNLDYGKKYTDFGPVTRQLRAIIDIETKKLAEIGRSTGYP